MHLNEHWVYGILLFKLGDFIPSILLYLFIYLLVRFLNTVLGLLQSSYLQDHICSRWFNVTSWDVWLQPAPWLHLWFWQCLAVSHSIVTWEVIWQLLLWALANPSFSLWFKAAEWSVISVTNTLHVYTGIIWYPSPGLTDAFCPEGLNNRQWSDTIYQL